MAEGSANVEGSLNQGTSRRALLKGTAIGVGALGAAAAEANTGIFSTTFGILGRALEAFFNRPTEAQLKAAAELTKENIEKFNYRVKDSPAIRQSGGLPAKVEPRIPPKGEPPIRVIKMLQPGDEILDAIPWKGTNYMNPARGEANVWLAFKDEQGRVVFIENNDEFLDPLVKS